MKTAFLIRALVVSLGFNVFFLTTPNAFADEKPQPLTQHEADSVKLLSFKRKMDNADQFLRFVSDGRHSLEDTLRVTVSSDNTVKMWAIPVFGMKRDIWYEVGIKDKFGTEGRFVFPDNGDHTVTWKYESGGIRSSEDFLRTFDGLLQTFCNQQGYKLPASSS